MKWYDNDGKNQDVIVSTRVRLARNLVDYPFRPKLTATASGEIISHVADALKDESAYEAVGFDKLSDNERAAYAEEHIVSPEFASAETPEELFVNEKNNVYIMVGEEDHIRIQCIKAGDDLKGATRAALDAESLLDDNLTFAFSPKYGYLTHCPTNLGCAMRASVMMFLPLLSANGRIPSLQNQLAKLSLTMRGAWGEGSRAAGCLYQISNQSSLSNTEEEIIATLGEVIEKIAAMERELRDTVRENNFDALADRVMRAYGLMKFARTMDSEELFRLYADVRLGAAMGIIDGTSAPSLDRILIAGMPAVMAVNNKECEKAGERDRARAGMVREMLA